MTFNPRMLTLAREAEGMTQAALAHAIGASQALVSKIEHGLDEPSAVLAERMAQELRVPLEFFAQPELPVGEGLVDFFHRRRRTLPAKPLKRAHALANIVRFEVLRLLTGVELSDILPLPAFPSDEYEPAEAAQMVRATWRLPPGPVGNIVALLEAAGIPVVMGDLGHQKLSAISMPGVDGRHIVLLNETMPASHLRFAVAHELAHLVLHTGHPSTNMEEEADVFASEFLMPRADIAGELRSLRFGDLGTLKRRWHVSMAALMYQARSLGYLSDRQYTYMNMKRNQFPGGRNHEPGEFPHEEPKLLHHVVDYLTERLGYTFSDVAKLMVTSEQTLRTRYLGETESTLRGVGRGGGNLIRLPSLPSA